jgi:hypothetical protein
MRTSLAVSEKSISNRGSFPGNTLDDWLQAERGVPYEAPVITERGPLTDMLLRPTSRVLSCDELLTLPSFSRDPLADVCWAILELDVASFAAP